MTYFDKPFHSDFIKQYGKRKRQNRAEYYTDEIEFQRVARDYNETLWFEKKLEIAQTDKFAGKQTASINVDLFGRETPVEISFAEVRKIDS